MTRSSLSLLLPAVLCLALDLGCLRGGFEDAAIDAGTPGGMAVVTAAVVSNVSAQPPSVACPAGGQAISLGIDQNQNGALDPPEIMRVITICHGNDGQEALVEVEASEPGNGCSAGGLQIRTGLDADADGTLSAAETLRVEVVCNGMRGHDGFSMLTTIAELSPGERCSTGGVQVSGGLDLNRDGQLNEDEIQHAAIICNGENGSACTTYKDERMGVTTILCEDGSYALVTDGVDGATGSRGDAGPPGAPGADGASCSVSRDDDAGTTTIRCEDGTVAVIQDGEDGRWMPDAGPDVVCSVEDRGDGSKILTCLDGTQVIISDGAPGETGPAGPQGEAGAPGPPGENGASCTVTRDEDAGAAVVICEDGTQATIQDGADGATGAAGAAGQDGDSTLVAIDEDVGSECGEPGNGGRRIRTGLDNGDGGGIAGNGNLEEGEVDTTTHICNGQNGTDGSSCTVQDHGDGTSTIRCEDGSEVVVRNGADGQPGADGEDGDSTLVAIDEDVGLECGEPGNGGRRIRTGLDNGDGGGIAGNGNLEEGEVDTTTYICNGQNGTDGSSCTVQDHGDGTSTIRCEDGSEVVVSDGADGQPGAAGYSSLVRLDPELGGPICPYGGTRISSGLDVNRDNVLQDSEILDEAVVCSSLPGPCATGYAVDPTGVCVPLAPDPAGGTYAIIPAGTFTMGSPTAELGHESWEVLHEVTFSYNFAMGVTEVTQGQWKAITGGTNPSRFPDCGDDCPVEMVDWFSTLAYANTLSRAAGLQECYTFTSASCANAISDWADGGTSCADASFAGLSCTGYRLPTEAEWEYAYRAGTTTAYYNGPNSQTASSPLDPNLDAIAWYGGNSGVTYNGAYDCSSWDTGFSDCGTHPVATKEANAWGLHDMAGNVSELTWDWFAAYPGSTTDYVGPPTGTFRNARGGSWLDGAGNARAATRRYANFARRIYRGFRLARTLP